MIVVVVDLDLRDVGGGRNAFPKVGDSDVRYMRPFDTLESVRLEKEIAIDIGATVRGAVWWALDLDTGEATPI